MDRRSHRRFSRFCSSLLVYLLYELLNRIRILMRRINEKKNLRMESNYDFFHVFILMLISTSFHYLFIFTRLHHCLI